MTNIRNQTIDKQFNENDPYKSQLKAIPKNNLIHFVG